MNDTASEQILQGSPTNVFKQAGAGMIDCLLAIASGIVLIMSQIPQPFFKWLHEINSSLLILVLFAFYRLATLLLINATIGMKLFKINLLNGEGKRLSFLEKLLAAFFILYKGVAYYDQ